VPTRAHQAGLRLKDVPRASFAKIARQPRLDAQVRRALGLVLRRRPSPLASSGSWQQGFYRIARPSSTGPGSRSASLATAATSRSSTLRSNTKSRSMRSRQSPL